MSTSSVSKSPCLCFSAFYFPNLPVSQSPRVGKSHDKGRSVYTSIYLSLSEEVLTPSICHYLSLFLSLQVSLSPFPSLLLSHSPSSTSPVSESPFPSLPVAQSLSHPPSILSHLPQFLKSPCLSLSTFYFIILPVKLPQSLSLTFSA